MCAQTLEEYIASCVISDDDPGLLFSWNNPEWDLFVQNANAAIGPQPPWVTSPAGGMTVSSFQQDVISYLALLGDGSYGKVLVAPNNLLQYGNVRARLRDIETDPFVQASMAGIPIGSFLASTAIIHDRGNGSGTPSASAPPPAPHRQVFG